MKTSLEMMSSFLV